MGGGGAVVVVAGGIKRLFTKEESLGVSCKSGRGIAAFVAALIRPYVSSSTMTLDILLRCTIPGMSAIDNAVSIVFGIVKDDPGWSVSLSLV